jgi:hypothetical protein
MHPKEQKGELQILGCESNRIVDNNTRIEQPTMDERDWQLQLIRAPECRYCGGASEQQIVSLGNWNGNGGRPWYRCSDCHTFVCFADTRGIHPNNPRCDCPQRPLSRAQVVGEGNGQEIPRAVRFKCATGRCWFFKYKEDDQGEVVTLHDGPLDPKEVQEMGL